MTLFPEVQQERRRRIEYLGGPSDAAGAIGMNARLVQRIYSGRASASDTFDRRLWDAVLLEEMRRKGPDDV